MHLINRTIKILIATCFVIPFSSYAESWSCSHGNNVREVHIERTTAEPAPCNVVYKKQTEGVEDQILWNADNDGSYCEEKAEGFVAKLEGWGWVCAETITETDSDETTEVEATEEYGDDATESAESTEPTY